MEGFDQYKEGQNPRESKDEQQVYRFTAKYQFSTAKNNPLCGICLPQWLSILCKRRREIDWKTYWRRLAVITLLSCLNSLLALPDWLLFRNQIEATSIHPRPVFILGHPRTGTTLLHSLLAVDTSRFAFCTTFCSGFPSCFLWFESLGKRVFSNVLGDHRPMDNVKLHFDLPQEDELATNVLSSGTSPYMPLFLMRQEEEFRPYYAFRDDATGDESLPAPEMAKARKRWTSSFLFLLRKLTLRASLLNPLSESRHRLLLKSPVHTARIPLLLSLFPDAEFIYIHRHPYDVFRSAVHMADTTYWFTYLNAPTDAMIQEFILRQYAILWEHYEDGRALLRPNQLTEVSFDDLSTKPIEVVRDIYQHFKWSGWDEVETQLRAELAAVKAYQRNQYRPLPPALQRIVDERWGASFDRLGYDRGNPSEKVH